MFFLIIIKEKATCEFLSLGDRFTLTLLSKSFVTDSYRFNMSTEAARFSVPSMFYSQITYMLSGNKLVHRPYFSVLKKYHLLNCVDVCQMSTIIFNSAPSRLEQFVSIIKAAANKRCSRK